MANIENRKYTMTNSELTMFVSNLVYVMRRDATELATKGITPDMTNEFEALGNELEVFAVDEYYRADIMIAVDMKNARRLECEKMLREIVGIASIKWGDGSAQVKRFDSSGMTKIGDKVFMTVINLALFVAQEFLAELEDYGLNQEKIDALRAELGNMEAAMRDIAKFTMIRELKTSERQSKANALYQLAAKYCEAGKIIWQDTDLAKYDTYVISRSYK